MNPRNQIQLITDFWKDVADQDADRLGRYFLPDAQICWHNTNEQFPVGDYLRANCQYPGNWLCQVERVERTEAGAVSVARVWSPSSNVSLHATSFFTFEGGKIKTLDEYWGDDGPPPQWRREMGLGEEILS